MDLQDTIFVKLTPKASHNRIGEEKILPNGKSQLMVYVTAVAENGKANEALIKLLAKYFCFFEILGFQDLALRFLTLKFDFQ